MRYDADDALEALLAPPPLGHIDHWKLVDRLATGGMADVFLAVDPDQDDPEPLVIKRILPHLAEDGAFVRMFLQEARIALSVRHRNVVRMDRLGEHEGLPYLLMEFIPGLTFRQLVDEGQTQGRTLPDAVALDLVAQAAAGAHAIHETRVGEHTEIVHRDLCPHNLMVDEDGLVKVLDFGIAKAAQGMDTTRTGVLKGKTAYLAPEQVQHQPVDRRTDIWTLCVVAWELLARRRLFGELSDYDAMQAIAAGRVPPLGEVRPDLPALLVEAVHGGLQVDPDRRFATAADLRDTLLEAGRVAGVPAHDAATRAYVRAVLHLGDAPPDTDVTDASDVQLTRSEEVAPELPTDVPVDVPGAGPADGHRVATGGRRPWVALAVGFAVVALVLFGAGIAIGGLVIAPRGASGPAMTLTLAPVMPPEAMVTELEPLRTYLEAELERPVTFQVAPHYEGAGRLLAQGRTDLALLPPYLYLTTRDRMGEDLAIVAVTEHDGADGVDGVLLGRKDFPWEGPESLRGRRFCFTDPTSTTGFHLPRRYLRDHGIDPDTLPAPIMSGNHHQVIADLAAGRCEVGATFSGAVVSAYDVDVPVQQTRQLDITGRTPNDAVCAGPHTDPRLVEGVRAALLAWDPPTHHGRPFIGERQHLTGFGATTDAAWDPLRRALQGAPRDTDAPSDDAEALP